MRMGLGIMTHSGLWELLTEGLVPITMKNRPKNYEWFGPLETYNQRPLCNKDENELSFQVEA